VIQLTNTAIKEEGRKREKNIKEITKNSKRNKVIPIAAEYPVPIFFVFS